jgi:flavin reductase (DIM6/NTAB) family NADH-FMN oxidoreductase RutF
MPHALTLVDPLPELAPAAEYTAAMRALASGVVLVTCRFEGRPWGMTVTAFASVSAEPPTVLVSLGSGTTGARAITATHRFGVSILAADQLALARHGSAPGAARFLEPFVEPGGSCDGEGASPAVAGALAHLDCELSEAVEAADHTVFFGRVRAASLAGGGAPLVYQGRRYRTLAAD